MKLEFEIDESELRQIIAQYLKNRVDLAVDPSLIDIQVKSKQNYRAEWETAAFRAKFVGTVGGG